MFASDDPGMNAWTRIDWEMVIINTEICGVLESELGTDPNNCITNELSDATVDKSDRQIAFEIFVYTILHETIHVKFM